MGLRNHGGLSGGGWIKQDFKDRQPGGGAKFLGFYIQFRLFLPGCSSLPEYPASCQGQMSSEAQRTGGKASLGA